MGLFIGEQIIDRLHEGSYMFGGVRFLFSGPGKAGAIIHVFGVWYSTIEFKVAHDAASNSSCACKSKAGRAG